MALVQEGTLHHDASEHMVHTFHAVCTPNDLGGLQMLISGGKIY